MSATAIVETGGKQHRVAVGDVISVEKIPGAPGDAVELDKVLSVGEGGEIIVGHPYVENAKVIASIVRQERAKKVIIFKKKRRKNYRRTKGHRQYLTSLRIVEVRA